MSSGATVAPVGRRFLRPGWVAGHLLVVVAVLVCCRLGWWQWDRTKDADGTFQNLAYAVLWPAFGAAFVYMWWRFLQLELLKDASDEQEMDAGLASVLREGAAAEPNPVDRIVTSDTGPARAVAEPEYGPDDEPDDEPDGDAPSGGPQVFVGTVDDVDDDEDPELAAYNRALAALAEEDRRAR